MSAGIHFRWMEQMEAQSPHSQRQVQVIENRLVSENQGCGVYLKKAEDEE